uniref:Lung squamous cell carcinoma related protein-2 n=1 Tax=Homo sapiens TaxID=9606 RepID=Q96SE5_HUMAN|nr:lung squamous cell carcinoma related protein-2 [Homo sapiens]
MTGSNYMFKLKRNYQTVFQSNRNLHSHQQGIKVPVACEHLVISNFFLPNFSHFNRYVILFIVVLHFPNNSRC